MGCHVRQVVDASLRVAVEEQRSGGRADRYRVDGDVAAAERLLEDQGRPAVAPLVMFPASDAAHKVSGTTFSVTAGTVRTGPHDGRRVGARRRSLFPGAVVGVAAVGTGLLLATGFVESHTFSSNRGTSPPSL